MGGANLIHAHNVVHETLDGETIVIHLETGSYYSLTGSGAEIWTLVGTGSQVSDVCTELARRHDHPEADIRREVEAFLADLEREGLIEPGEGTDVRSPAPAAANGGWTSPKLERYDDMRDFLLVDPIHEVDGAGWPKAAE
jgi:hypothetical protein